MSKKTRFLWLAAAALLAVVLWRLAFPGDVSRIQKLLVRLAETASSAGARSTLGGLAAASKLADFFAPDFLIDVEVPGVQHVTLSDRATLVQAALAARSQGRGARLDFLDIVVQLGDGRTNATAEATARITFTGQRDPSVSELRFSLAKIGRDWRVSGVETRRTFQ